MRTAKSDKRIRFIVFIVFRSFTDAQDDRLNTRDDRLYIQNVQVNILDDKMLRMSGMLHQAKMPEMKMAMIASGAM
jgi:hypothetical protein